MADYQVHKRPLLDGATRCPECGNLVMACGYCRQGCGFNACHRHLVSVVQPLEEAPSHG